MALPSSGPLSISQIRNEQVNSFGYPSTYSLRQLSANAGKTSPDSISEFYGYGPSPIASGLVLYLNAGNPSSYPGSGTAWNDISGNAFNSTLVNGPTYSSANGGLIVLSGASQYVSIPGNTTIYSTDFTWQSYDYWNGSSPAGYNGLWWSEAGVKNFLMVYANVPDSSTYMRIDTGSNVYFSTDSGVRTNGFVSTAGPILNTWLLTTIVKSGNTFYLYWNNAVLMWTVTISDWGISNTSQPITFGARSGGSYPSIMSISTNLMYNRALSTTEISQNYTILRSQLGI